MGADPSIRLGYNLKTHTHYAENPLFPNQRVELTQEDVASMELPTTTLEKQLAIARHLKKLMKEKYGGG
jgi:hypothetical protein